MLYIPLGGEAIDRRRVARNVADLIERFPLPIVVTFEGKELRIEPGSKEDQIFAQLSNQKMFEDDHLSTDALRDFVATRVRDILEGD